MFYRIFKTLLFIVGGLVSLVMLAIVAIYIPAVQDFALQRALTAVNRGDSLHVEVGRLRLRPPLKLEVDRALVVIQGDTMLQAGRVDVDVALRAIFYGNAAVDNINLEEIRLAIGNRDSALYLGALVNHAVVDDASYSLWNKQLDVSRLSVDGASVALDLQPTPSDTVTKPESESLPLDITVKEVALKNLGYSMTMPPVIDSLTASVPDGRMSRVRVSLKGRSVKADKVSIDSVSARYLTAATTASTPTEPTAVTDSVADSRPWTVGVNHIALTATEALYATTGAIPMPGFDPSYINARDISIEIDSFLNRGADIRVPVRRIAATERCGVKANLSGHFSMLDGVISMPDAVVSTLYSRLNINFVAGFGTATLPDPLLLKTQGYLSPLDAAMILPAMQPLASGLPVGTPVNIDADLSGGNNLLIVNNISVEIPHILELAASGEIANPTDPEQASGVVNIFGRMASEKWLKPTLLAARLDKVVAVPPITLNGKVTAGNGLISGTLKAMTHKGRLALDARWRGKSEQYAVGVKASDFPVEAFLPMLGVRNVTADVSLQGRGYNPLSHNTSLKAQLDVTSVNYLKKTYGNVSLSALLDKGLATAHAVSHNHDAAFDITATGNLDRLPYDWTIDARVDNLDLQAMGITDSLTRGTAVINGNVSIGRLTPLECAAEIDVPHINLETSAGAINTTNLSLTFEATDSSTLATLLNHDLSARLHSPQPLDSIVSRLSTLAPLVDTIIAKRDVDVKLLQRSLPPLSLKMTGGQDNVLNHFLESGGMSFTRLDLAMVNDSAINLDGDVRGLTVGKTLLDTITASVNQRGDRLRYRVHLGNRPGTLDSWARVSVGGTLGGNHATVLLLQEDINGKTGYRLGFDTRLSPEAIRVKVVPSHPIIGYKDWHVNDSNFIYLNTRHHHFDADLAMSSAESSLRLFTEHGEDSLQEDVVLKINDIKIQEWMVVNPFAPAVAGDVSADMRFAWTPGAIDGTGVVSLTDLTYGKDRVGTFDLGLDLSTNTQGTIRANASLLVDGVKTVTARGTVNDSTATNPFMLDFRMIRFPLSVLNPFLPREMARINGTLNGSMDITGTPTRPIFNGFLNFDSTTMAIPMAGTTYRFSNEKIAMDSNVVTFSNFAIKGANDNPLTINGTVDARHLNDIKIDLAASARNMQAVGSKKRRGVQLYGKAFVDLDATVNGSLSRLDVNADVSLLPATNVTYILADATDNLVSQSKTDIVTFVNFADTARVAELDSVTPGTMAVEVNARLNVRQGSTVTVDLSTDGKNRVQLQASGTLNYGLNYMGDSRLTGRLNLNNGFVRYTPPLMSEKLFTFLPESYVSFTGPIMNPYLNIKAVDVLRANVQQEGQNSRIINFDVTLSVTNSLEDMDVAFDLSTDDDITVANELQSMSPDQRANQAMNLLLYNVYTGPGTKATSSLNGNPLFAFLESQVNSWAANNIKGVDLSFGIDQYDRTYNGMSTTATQYSYRVSKSLFNDRFKIVIGGNYASDVDPDQNLQQNLINDISFEYFITPTGSMYVKIFRHTGYESILEGEVTQTGVGFVYKRKLRRLRDLFTPFGRRPASPVTTPTTTKP